MSRELDFSRSYGFARGFSWRRESFGGILYHYEGEKPDPHVFFVDSPFLVSLLEVLDQAPLDGVIAQVKEHFQLKEDEITVIRRFLETLAEKGALIPK